MRGITPSTACPPRTTPSPSTRSAWAARIPTRPSGHSPTSSTTSFGAESGDLLLLLDAEGAEWEQLAECDDAILDRFGVIGVELHDLGDLILDPTAKLAVLERLNAMFVPVAVHANNHAAVWSLPGLELPDALEVTYVNRRLQRTDGTVGNCAADLLAPCCPDLPDGALTWIH